MRINHVGDWGTQFGMLICHLQDKFPTNVHEEATKNLTDLTVFYKEAKERFDAEPEFKARSQAQVVKLQGGEEESRKLWTLLCDISRQEFYKVSGRTALHCTALHCTALTGSRNIMFSFSPIHCSVILILFSFDLPGVRAAWCHA